VYYEILLKLVNKFLTKTTIFFKLILFYINYNYTNHIVETCCNKGELVVIVLEVIVKSSKSPKPMNYPCHIYRVIDALPSPGVNPLEGSPKCSCGKRDSEGRSRLPTLERGRGSSWEPRD